MEENIKLVKDFSHTPQIMRQGIRAYQKKFIYPKAIVKSVIFVLLSIAAVFISGMLDEKIRLLGYLALVGFLALAYREIFNPLKQRDNIVMSMNGNGIIPLNMITGRRTLSTFSTYLCILKCILSSDIGQLLFAFKNQPIFFLTSSTDVIFLICLS